MSELKTISIRGAREHNLKGIDLDLPRNSLIVMTGLSGSGKSSLAFDTIYAEGQRRYVERGFFEVVFCSMEMAGDSPSIWSTSGFCIISRNWRA